MTVSRSVRRPEESSLDLGGLDDAHSAAADAIGNLPPHGRHLAERWLREQLSQALASIRPSWFAGTEPAVLTPPRGYLSADQRARLAGVRAALWHVEARQSHHDLSGRPLIDPYTPFVLHALAEGRRDPDPPTDPGLVRASDTRWNVRDHPYHHPPAEDCSGLIDATLDELATQGRIHPVVQAAWLAFAWMSIHPFVDGNGRTARLLYLLVAGPGVATGHDLGVAEQWVFHRHHYQEALSRGQKVARGFDASRLDPNPFVSATVEWSTRGAHLTRRRAEALAAMWDVLAPLDSAARAAVLAVGLLHVASPEDLPTTIGAYEERLATLQELESAGIVRRVALPPSRRSPGAPPRPHYTLVQQAAQRLRGSVAQA